MKLLGTVLSVWMLALWTPRAPETAVQAPARSAGLVREVELGRAAREVARVTGVNVLVNQALERVKVPEGLGTPAGLAAAAKAQAVRLGHVSGRATWALVPVGHPAFTAPPGEPGGAGQHADLHFDAVEADAVFGTLAMIGRFNVVTQPAEARRRLTLSLRQMTPLQSLYAVAEVQGLVVTPVEGVAATTYLVQRRASAQRRPPFEVAAGVSEAAAGEFNFRDVQLLDVTHTLALLAGVNVVLDPQVARAKMNLCLRGVTPLQALRVMCAAQELGARTLDEITPVTTVMVARPDKMRPRATWTPPRGADARRVSWRFHDVELSGIVRTMAMHAGVNVAVDPQVARARMVFQADRLTALEALAALVRVQELGMAPAPIPSGRPAYLIGRRERVERRFCPPRLVAGRRQDRVFDDVPFAEACARLARDGGFAVEDRVTNVALRTGRVAFDGVTPSEALALLAWMLGLQLRATSAGYALDRPGAEADAPALTQLYGVSDADARLRQSARQARAHVVTQGAGADRIRLVLLEQPQRAPVPLQGGPRRSLRVADRSLPSMAEEISREHGATVLAAGRYFWPRYSMELSDVSVGAVVDALAAVGTRPLSARELPGFGRPTYVIAPPAFAVPAFPVRPASEARQHVRFAGLPWRVAVRHLASLGGFQIAGSIPDPRGGTWSDRDNAALDLPDTTPLEALYLLALRNGLKVVADPDAEAGSTYRLE